MTDLSPAEVHEHPVRVAWLNDDAEQPPQPGSAALPLSPDAQSAVRRLTSAPALTLAWAASLPVAGGGLVWYAALHCFVC